MEIHLEISGVRDDFREEWRKYLGGLEVPRVGDHVHLGTRTGSARHLELRQVSEVIWAADLDTVTVTLEDLDAGWFLANRSALVEAGWTFMVAAG